MQSYKLKFNKNKFNILLFGEYSFYIGIFLLSSALPIAALFLLLSIFIAIFKFRSKFFFDNYNFIFLFISVLLISSSFYKNIFAESFNLDSNYLISNWVDNWKDNGKCF